MTTNGASFHPFLRLDGRPRIETDVLYPPFRARLELALAKCHDRGADYYATSGHRSYDEQARRHAAFVAGTGTRAAPAGGSQHQFGLAVDLVPDGDLVRPGLQADYARKNYDILLEVVAELGLHSGVGYNDAPHVGVPRFVSAKDLKPLAKIYRATAGDERTKLAAVHAYLDGLPLFPAALAA